MADMDTRDKRFNAIGIAKQWIVAAPNPDGVITSAGDRQQIAYSYRGITAGTPGGVLWSWWAWARFGEPI